MRFRDGVAAAIAVGLALVVSSAISISAQESPGSSVEILFDFGDGSYVWASADVPSPDATNATWDAIQEAAEGVGIPIEATWFACCGVAITDVGDRDPPSGFPGLFVWNASARRWDFALEGVSTLVLRDGDALALYNAAFDSVTFGGRTPVPTPENPHPSVMFRGDSGNRGVSGSASPGRPRVLWDRDTGVPEIGSTPAVAYGRVFVNTIEGLLALDAATGEVAWRAPEARGFSSPAVFDGSVFVGSSNGTAYRLNSTDGEVEWAASLLVETGFSGLSSSPKIVFDWVFIGTFNESGGPGEVVSLWASNGSVRWRTPTESVHFSSPAYANGSVYVGVAGRYNTTSQITFDPPYGVLALDAATGEERWFFETSGSVSASPAIADGRVIVPAKDGLVYAVDMQTGTEAWSTAVAAGVSSAAVVGDTAYVGGGAFGAEGRVTAIDLSTGSERWSFAPNGPVQASVTYADGRIFSASNVANGTIYAVTAADGRLAWQFTPTPPQYVLSSPVVADGVVFAASDNGHVYAIAAAESADGQAGLSWPAVAGLLAVAVVVVAVGVAVMVSRRVRRGP